MSLSHPTNTTALALPVLAAWAAHALLMHHQIDQARRDPLTHLLTRDGWTRRAQRIVRDRGAVVLLLDLDQFKTINDTYGHAAGDLVLAATAARLAVWCAPGGVAGRLGGDEFVAALPSHRSRDITRAITELHTAIARPITGLPDLVRASASIGYARAGEEPGADLSRLLLRADSAMYVAKAARSGHHDGDRLMPETATATGRRKGRPGTAAGTDALQEVAA
jgi:diguanylate cyclase (GGDEF)-like protein